MKVGLEVKGSPNVVNKRKGMKFISMWMMPYEYKEIKNIMEKETRTEREIAQIGEILITINARRDFDTR